MAENYKILIVGPSWVGDMVMAHSLIQVLAKKHHNCHIDVLAPEWSRPLTERMPEVNDSIPLPLGHGQLQLMRRRRIGKALRGRRYQQVILLPNSFKSALIPWWASIPRRTGWLGEMRWGLVNDIRTLDKQQYPLMVERFVALAGEARAPLPENIPAPHLTVSRDSVNAAKERHQLSNDRSPVLALCPGAEFGASKRWPEQHYAAVANEKLAAGWQVWLFGSVNDKPVAQTIQQQTNNRCHDLTGRTSLADAIDLLSCADSVVSNDSGLMHIAAALHRPLIAVYGSSSSAFTPPLAEQVRTLSQGLACQPCFKRECPLQHLDCLHQLAPERVLQALAEVTL